MHFVWLVFTVRSEKVTDIVFYLSCHVVLPCIFILWKLVRDVLIWIHKRETEGSCTLSKCVLQQVWCLKFHEKGWGLNHTAWILDQTSKRNNRCGKNWTITMCQNQQAHRVNVITWLGLLWGTGKHSIPLRDYLSRPSASSESDYSRISHLNTMPIHSSLLPTLLCHAKWCQLPWSMQNLFVYCQFQEPQPVRFSHVKTFF